MKIIMEIWNNKIYIDSGVVNIASAHIRMPFEIISH